MSTIAFSLCTSQSGRYIFHEILQHKCLPRQQQRQVVRRAKELLDKWVQRLNEMGWIFLSVKFDIARLHIEWGIGTVSLLPHQTHLYIIKYASSFCCEELQCAKYTLGNLFPGPRVPNPLTAYLIVCPSSPVTPLLGGGLLWVVICVLLSTNLSIQGPHSKLPLLVSSHSEPLFSWPITLRQVQRKEGKPDVQRPPMPFRLSILNPHMLSPHKYKVEKN